MQCDEKPCCSQEEQRPPQCSLPPEGAEEMRQRRGWRHSKADKKTRHLRTRVRQWPAVPSLTPGDVIGDGGLVYHIWQSIGPSALRELDERGRHSQKKKERQPLESFTNKARPDGSCSPKQTP